MLDETDREIDHWFLTPRQEETEKRYCEGRAAESTLWSLSCWHFADKVRVSANIVKTSHTSPNTVGPKTLQTNTPPLSLCAPLCPCVCVCFSVCSWVKCKYVLSLSLCVWLWLCLSLSLALSICLSLSLSVCLSLSLSVSVSLSLSLSLCVVG